MIRQESKQIISVATAVCVVERFSIGLKSKNLSIDASDIRGRIPVTSKDFETHYRTKYRSSSTINNVNNDLCSMRNNNFVT